MATTSSPSASSSSTPLGLSKANIDTYFTTQYWAALCPFLHVDDAAFQRDILAIDDPAAQSENDLSAQVRDWRTRMDTDGYFVIAPEEMSWCANADAGTTVPEGNSGVTRNDRGGNGIITALAKGITTLMEHGWPASFISIYDESWLLVEKISKIMKETSGGNAVNMDILSWCIDPYQSQSGFSPHRDRQPDCVLSSFRADGSPKYSTCWIALTDACPDNSCLYVIPRGCDPGYTAGDGDEDPMRAALPNKEAYQNIKSLPVQSGGAVLFSHRIIHWGSAGRKGHATPRISFSAAFASDDFEPSYFERSHLPFPDLALRVSLVGGQMIAYSDRFQFGHNEISLFHRMFLREKGQFHQSYQLKVTKELMAAAEASESVGGVQSGGGDGGGNSEDDDDDDDDLLDDALDAMLDAEMENPGFDGFDDDFDDVLDADDQLSSYLLGDGDGDEDGDVDEDEDENEDEDEGGDGDTGEDGKGKEEKSESREKRKRAGKGKDVMDILRDGAVPPAGLMGKLERKRRKK
eukprot:TRINITY_DN306_c2_g2_i1.p1 TRINITY_DN306_c2_g2~~TRINITY_DN306_c2_g2_i1.p1  ORF type:complete len:521 (-),score=134.59 TRINITY_DN306_c2_g2_i1:66-1628(-)